MRITLLCLAFVLTLALAAPAFASHDPNATGCERAHECGEQYLYALPPGYDISTSTSVYAYNPLFSGWGYSDAMEMHQLCSTNGGYFYWADGGEYWNAC